MDEGTGLGAEALELVLGVGEAFEVFDGCLTVLHVHQLVEVEVALLVEAFTTHLASEGFLAAVDAPVDLHVVL